VPDNPAARVAFDVIDLAEGAVEALPHVFGPLRERLLQRLLEEEGAQRKRDLALLAYDTRRGLALNTLRSSLAALQRMVIRCGGTDEEAEAMPRATLEAMLRSRLAEVATRLVDAKLRIAEADAEDAEGAEGDEGRREAWKALRGHIVTLLAAERAEIERVLERSEADDEQSPAMAYE